MRCWFIEAALVSIILSVSAILSGGKLTDWIGAAAVLLTFMHGQLSFDLQESQEQLPQATVPSFKWSGRLFIAKEALWLVTFMMLGAWPLFVATLIFAAYPAWRRWLRSRFGGETVKPSLVKIANPGGSTSNATKAARRPSRHRRHNVAA